MNDIKVIKTVVSVSRALDFLSTVATIVAVLSIARATVSCFRR